MENLKIDWTRINNDVNGNPRYVCHFTSIPVTDEEINRQSGVFKTIKRYKAATKKANKIGGKRYHTKTYGGGIVFQSYNLYDTEKSIFELLND